MSILNNPLFATFSAGRIVARIACRAYRPWGEMDTPPLSNGRTSVVRASAPPSRELRLRRRIDALLAQRAAKERRILALEGLLRIDGGGERIATLEQRCNHLNRRLIELSEQLREARAA